MAKRFSIAGRFTSIRFALRGVRMVLLGQHNAWIHAVASGVVILAGFILHVDRNEWCWLVIAMMAVWTAEGFNTAFEFLCDVASPDFHPTVEKAKDVAAGAVLCSAIGSVVIGVLVFGPHVMRLIFHG